MKDTTMSETSDSSALIRALENKRIYLQGELAIAERGMDEDRVIDLEDELIGLAYQKERLEKSSTG